MEVKEIIEYLNELLEVTEDARKGFVEAAEKTTCANLRVELVERTHASQAAIESLGKAIRSLGGEPTTKDELRASAHPAWISIKAAEGDENVAVLEGVAHGARSAKQAYRKLLAMKLPPKVQRLLQTQYTGILMSQDRFRDLRDAYSSDI